MDLSALSAADLRRWRWCRCIRTRRDLPAGGHTVARHTVMRSLKGFGDRTPREYRSAHEVTLWLLELAEARCFADAGRACRRRSSCRRRGARGPGGVAGCASPPLRGAGEQCWRSTACPFYLAGAARLPLTSYTAQMLATGGLHGQSARRAGRPIRQRPSRRGGAARDRPSANKRRCCRTATVRLAASSTGLSRNISLRLGAQRFTSFRANSAATALRARSSAQGR